MNTCRNNHHDRLLWLHTTEPGGWIRTNCRLCHKFIGRRPPPAPETTRQKRAKKQKPELID